jgi:hypothetical protein
MGEHIRLGECAPQKASALPTFRKSLMRTALTSFHTSMFGFGAYSDRAPSGVVDEAADTIVAHLKQLDLGGEGNARGLFLAAILMEIQGMNAAVLACLAKACGRRKGRRYVR